jgi:type I site-specific restriction endonuclease
MGAPKFHPVLSTGIDILIYDSNHKPWMLIECKAGEISLNENVLLQVLRYHVSLPASFVVITNGHYTYAWEKTGGELKEILQMPRWR